MMNKFTALVGMMLSSPALANEDIHSNFPSEAQCLQKFEHGNKTFTEGLKVLRDKKHSRTLQATDQEQICMLYYLWQKDQGAYDDFPEDQGICWNVWGQWSPVAKDTYMQLCTGRMMF